MSPCRECSHDYTSASAAIEKLPAQIFQQWFIGPAGSQLGTGTNNLPLRLKVPEFELGIIAAARSHPCMVWNKKIIAQTKHFPEHGQFNRAGGTPAQKEVQHD